MLRCCTPLTRKYDTMPCFKWVQELGRGPDTPDGHKNVSGSVGTRQKKCIKRQAINQASERWVRDLGDGPMRLEEWVSLAVHSPDSWAIPAVASRSPSSSSSRRAIGTDIPDPFSLPLPIVYRFRQVLRATPRIRTELLYVGSSWSSCFRSAMWRVPPEYITYELVPTSPAVSCMSGSCNLDSFRDGW